jgi:hypothetical protein
LLQAADATNQLTEKRAPGVPGLQVQAVPAGALLPELVLGLARGLLLVWALLGSRYHLSQVEWG